ncbi:MAG TPA: Crp/Fnr family transcriptional regulator [Chloroflexota bacterium]|nr:Crp/Fnr family transcriptional regulator [Chloroflexota bacterium]
MYAGAATARAPADSDASWRPAAFATRLRCGAGRVLVRAGERAESVYLIRRGQARTYVLTRDGRETTTAVLGPGQLLGISPLLGLDAYHEWAEALGELDVWVLPTQRLLDELGTNRELLGLVVGALAQRLAQGVTLLADVALGSAAKRATDVAELLRRQLGEAPRLNKRLFSDLIGVRPETLSRVSHRPFESPAPVDTVGPENMDGAVERAFARGETMPLLGEQVYVLRSGLVRLSIGDRHGPRRIILDDVASGCFGLPPLVAGQPRLALVAEALTPVAVWVLSPTALLRLFDAQPELACRVVSETARRLAHVEQLLHRAHQPTARARVASLLVELAKREGEPDGAGRWRLPATWTHAALAQAVGARRETVTRALGELSARGHVRRVGHRLLVCDPPDCDASQPAGRRRLASLT